MKINIIKPGRQSRYIKRSRIMRRYYYHHWRQKNKFLIRQYKFDELDDLKFNIVNKRGHNENNNLL